MRVFYVAFPIEALAIEWSAIFAALAALSMTVGNLGGYRPEQHQAYARLQHHRPRWLPHGRARGGGGSRRDAPGRCRSVRSALLSRRIRGYQSRRVRRGGRRLQAHRHRRVRQLRGPGPACAAPSRGVGLRDGLADRRAPDRWVHGQDLHIRRGGQCRARLACHRRRAEQRGLSLLLPEGW